MEVFGRRFCSGGSHSTEKNGLTVKRIRDLGAIEVAAVNDDHRPSKYRLFEPSDGGTGPGAAYTMSAEELRVAGAALGDIVGTRSADALLGEIFGQFCIGK